MISVKHDDTASLEGTPGIGACIGRALRGVWHTFLDGAAIYGACMAGLPIPEDIRSDAARQVDGRGDAVRNAEGA